MTSDQLSTPHISLCGWFQAINVIAQSSSNVEQCLISLVPSSHYHHLSSRSLFLAVTQILQGFRILHLLQECLCLLCYLTNSYSCFAAQIKTQLIWRPAQCAPGRSRMVFICDQMVTCMKAAQTFSQCTLTASLFSVSRPHCNFLKIEVTIHLRSQSPFMNECFPSRAELQEQQICMTTQKG